MNLKEEITKSDKLKNDLKLAKNNINDRILSGGGTKANTISEVPGKIDEMLGNYKKVAYITPPGESLNDGWFHNSPFDARNKITIPLNLNFRLGELYIGVSLGRAPYVVNRRQRITKVGEIFKISESTGEYIEFKVTSFTKNQLSLSLVDTNEHFTSRELYWTKFFAVER